MPKYLKLEKQQERNESWLAFSSCIGKKIIALGIEDNALLFQFDNNTGLKIVDEQSSCCEIRYMNTDDDLSYYINSILQDCVLREGGSVDIGDESHNHTEQESSFLIITTDKGQFTIVNYNEHNGYYEGFDIVVSIVKGEVHFKKRKA